jgi:hypothetical protein
MTLVNHNTHIFIDFPGPNNPNEPNLLKKIREQCKNIDQYFIHKQDPLTNSWLKYFSNANIIGISTQNLLPVPVKIGTHLISNSHVIFSTYYEYRRNKYISNKNKKTIEYGSILFLKSIVFYPSVSFAVCKTVKKFNPNIFGKISLLAINFAMIPILDKSFNKIVSFYKTAN